jgi:hypothetical protein
MKKIKADDLESLLHKMNRIKRQMSHHYTDKYEGIMAFECGMYLISYDLLLAMSEYEYLKRLVFVESFFSENTYLKSYVCFSANQFVSPKQLRLLTAARIEYQLEVLQNHCKDLSNPNTDSVHLLKTIQSLINLTKVHFQENSPKGDIDYKKRAMAIIDKEIRPNIKMIDNYKVILANLILLISTLGTAFLLNKMVNDHFFFAQNPARRQTEQIRQLINREVDNGNESPEIHYVY